jgi:hypothetical protein
MCWLCATCRSIKQIDRFFVTGIDDDEEPLMATFFFLIKKNSGQIRRKHLGSGKKININEGKTVNELMITNPSHHAPIHAGSFAVSPGGAEQRVRQVHADTPLRV